MLVQTLRRVRHHAILGPCIAKHFACCKEVTEFGLNTFEGKRLLTLNEQSRANHFGMENYCQFSN